LKGGETYLEWPVNMRGDRIGWRKEASIETRSDAEETWILAWTPQTIEAGNPPVNSDVSYIQGG
jgi:hypothetical protein